MKNIIYIITILFIISCGNSKKKSEATVLPIPKTTQVVAKKVDKGYKYMKTYCYACHNPHAKSHDVLIAPPMEAIKRRYSKEFKSKKEFSDAITNWVLNANDKDALMLNAVKKFGVMPKLPFPKSHLDEISNFMFDNELEKPSWFEEHASEKH